MDDKLQRKIERARQIGMPKELISKFATQEKSQPKKGGAWTGLLPTAFGIGGSILGAPLGLPGIIGGGAVASAAGEALRQKITGEKPSTGKILGEGAWGLVGGGVSAGITKVVGKFFAKKVVGGLVKKVVQEVAESVPKLAKRPVEQAFEISARTFASAFKIPTRFVDKLKPVETSSEILKHGFGFKTNTMSGLKNVVEQVTGDSGIVNRLVSNVAANVKRINVKEVITRVRNLAEFSISDRKAVNEALLRITRIMGGHLGKIDGLSALDKMRKLEQIGYSYLSASKRNIVDPAKYEDLAKLYLGAADELMGGLTKAAGDKNLVNLVKTPDVINSVQKISKRLADQVIKANTLRDLRKIQAPFVRLGRMLRLSEESAQGVTAGFGRETTTRIMGTVTGGSLAGLPGMVAGFIMAPMVEGIAESSRFPLMTIAAQGQKLAGKNLPSVMSAISKMAKSVLPPTIGQVGTRTVFGERPDPLSFAGGVQTADFPETPEALGQLGSPTEIEQPKIPNERFVAAMIFDLAQNNGKNIDKLEKIYKYANQGSKQQISSTTLRSLSAVKVAEGYVNELDKMLTGVGLVEFGPLARVSGIFRRKAADIGFDPKVRTYMSLRRAMTAKMARALGEVGALSDRDRLDILATIPTPDDSVEEAKRKLDEMKYLMRSAGNVMMDLERQYATSSTDTGELPMSPMDVEFSQEYAY